jgi:hypothetical protein
MTLDSEEQRALLLDLLSASTVPGRAIDLAYELKQAIIKAHLEPEADENLEQRAVEP